MIISFAGRYLTHPINTSPFGFCIWLIAKVKVFGMDQNFAQRLSH
jgi:hypothetical protein